MTHNAGPGGAGVCEESFIILNRFDRIYWYILAYIGAPS